MDAGDADQLHVCLWDRRRFRAAQLRGSLLGTPSALMAACVTLLHLLTLRLLAFFCREKESWLGRANAKRIFGYSFTADHANSTVSVEELVLVYL